MENVRICTVVTGKTLDEFLTNLQNTQKIADFIELRVDHIKGFAIDQVEVIKNNTSKTAIFTCRKKDEGGMFVGSEDERKTIIEKASELEFGYIDIELSATNNFNFSKLNSKIILSFHDFAKTPSSDILEQIKQNMKQYQKTIMKFATAINDDNDRNILLKLLLDKHLDEEMIIIGMGEKGKLIRILGPLLGSFCTFASTQYGETAPGQIDIEEMEKIYNILPFQVS